jgi:aspartate racemase
MKTVGIIGGVGPEATNKFCELLINYKSRRIDQDNIPFVHYCNPQIPDRTEFIIGKGESPVPELVKTSRALEKINVDFLVIPCNTAHCFLREIQRHTSLPIVDMMKVLVNKVKHDNSNIEKIGVLATTGSIKAKLFERYFHIEGIEVIKPDENDQEKLVMEAIYGEKGIKAGKKLYGKKLLNDAAKKLLEKGAQAIVLGCTEVPLVMKQKDFGVRLYDPMDIVAREIVGYIESKEDKEIVTCGPIDYVDEIGSVDISSSVSLEVK